MSHENKSMRLTGDLYAFRIVDGVEQKGLGPLNADVISLQANSETIDVPDKRRGRRGQLMATYTDASPATGTLTLYSVPSRIIAMLTLGAVVSRSDVGGTVSAENVSLEADYWTPLAHRNISDFVLVPGIKAALSTGVEGNDNAITWTAVSAGTAGNAITVAIVNPGTNNAALSIDVDGTDIVVNCATDGSAAITSTAALVMAAIQASEDASALVTVASTGASDGTGVVVAAAEANLSAGDNSGGTAYTIGTDYEIDDKLGLVRPIATGGLTQINAFASYSHGAVTGERIEVGSDITTRARLVLRGVNDADGSPMEWEAYRAVLTPSGALNLMASEPMQAEFALKFETPDNQDHPVRIDYPEYA